MRNRYGVVDIGTLKVKFLVVEVERGGVLKELYKSNTLTCFGCEIDQNGGKVKEEYLNRTLEELKRCQQLLKEYGVEKFKVVSTHAMRRAVNKGEILERIEQELGWEVENISQEDEARLFFKAVMAGFLGNEREYVVVDMGGGSVQLLKGSREGLLQTHMMQTGAAYLHDNFTQDPSSPLSFTREKDVEKMRNYILEQLLPFEAGRGVPIIYGSSNIIDLMQAIKLPLEIFGESAVHPYKVYAWQLEQFMKEIWPVPYEERERKYEFQKGYMWGIDKAFLNIVTIAEYLDSPYIIPSNANIAQGVVWETME